VLHDEGVAYAHALEAAGVTVTLRDFEDMAHGFIRWGGVVDRTRELIADLGEHVRTALRA
jgi:acetyl esterase